MGICAVLKQCSTILLARLIENSNLLELFINEALKDTSIENYDELDLDKYWHSLHFVLTKDSSCWEECNLDFLIQTNTEDSFPLVNLLMSRKIFDQFDATYNPVRYFEANEVEQIAGILPEITQECLEIRYHQAAIIHPDNIYKPV